jgi:hypothetical protein
LHRLSLAVVKLQDQLLALADHEQGEREKLALRLQLEGSQRAPRQAVKKKSGRKQRYTPSLPAVEAFPIS